jgi:hypothetical protein
MKLVIKMAKKSFVGLGWLTKRQYSNRKKAANPMANPAYSDFNNPNFGVYLKTEICIDKFINKQTIGIKTCR